jgi:hypothetical protein
LAFQVKIYHYTFTNEELFTVTKINAIDNELFFELERSEFAHYLLTQVTPNISNPCISVAVNSLLETLDGYYVLGKMASNTSLADKVKFIGGAISREDLLNDQFQIRNTIIRELQEEVGFKEEYLISEEAMAEVLIMTKEDFMLFNVLVSVPLNLTMEDFHSRFTYFNDKQKEMDCNELDDLVFLQKNPVAINDFINNSNYSTVSYLNEALLVLSNQLESGNILKVLEESRGLS